MMYACVVSALYVVWVWGSVVCMCSCNVCICCICVVCILSI